MGARVAKSPRLDSLAVREAGIKRSRRGDFWCDRRKSGSERGEVAPPASASGCPRERCAQRQEKCHEVTCKFMPSCLGTMQWNPWPCIITCVFLP